MRHRQFRALLVVSLLLVVMILGRTWTSYGREREPSYSLVGHTMVSLSAHDGVERLQVATGWPWEVRSGAWRTSAPPPPAVYPGPGSEFVYRTHSMAVECEPAVEPQRGTTVSTAPAALTVTLVVHSFAVPHWALAVAAVAPPILWFLRFEVKRRLLDRREASRIAAGCCRSCGYDLRGSTNRCPECGTPAR